MIYRAFPVLRARERTKRASEKSSRREREREREDESSFGANRLLIDSHACFLIYDNVLCGRGFSRRERLSYKDTSRGIVTRCVCVSEGLLLFETDILRVIYRLRLLLC